MKIIEEDIIISIGFPVEIICFITAGVFLFVNTWLYFIFGILGIWVGYIVGQAIKLKERKRYY